MLVVPLSYPGHGPPISAATRIHPLAGTGVAVVTELALGVSRRTLLSAPDREDVPVQLVHVVEGVAHVVVQARSYVLAWVCSKFLFVSDDLDAPDPLSILLEIDALDEEEAALHPLEGNPSLRAPGHLPGADQPVQTLEVGVRLRRLLVSLGVGVVVGHNGLS